MLSALFRETEIHAQRGLDDLVGGIQADVGESVLVAHEAVLLVTVVLRHGDGGHSQEGQLEAGAPLGGDGYVAARHQLGHIGHVVVDIEVVVAVILEQFLDIVLGTPEGYHEVHIGIFGLGDDAQQAIGVVLGIGSSEYSSPAWIWGNSSSS